MMMDISNKREAGQFEPPPWEREQFEELQRRRQEQDRLEQASEHVAAPVEQTPIVEPQPNMAAREDEASPEEVVSKEPQTESPPRETGADDKMMAAMLLQLQAEEPARNEALWKIGIVFSIGAIAIGLVLLVWGFVAMVRTGSLGATGVVGSTILMAFGGLFVGLGIWTAVRSLKQRGVL